jgi:orotidine-5'-phosphate decarboxylase
VTDRLKKVVVALDCENLDAAKGLVDTLGCAIEWYKIGPILFTRSGHQIVQFLQNRKKKIFFDLKLYDTPNVVAETVRQFGEMGGQFATVHCLGGRTMLEAAGAACRGTGLRLIGVTLLTSQGAPDSMQWGWPQNELQMVERLTDIALECRLAGVMCSPQELPHIHHRRLPGFLLITPGIRLPNEEVFRDDQKRVASPNEAFEAGADYLIVGRPITQSREPLKVVERLFSA